MRITTWNVNGIRAAIRKGIEKHIEVISPDVLLLQEVRAFREQLPSGWNGFNEWHMIWNSAAKKGYSGTAILSRDPVTLISMDVDRAGDDEGRLIEATVNGLGIASVYLPSGSSGEHRQQVKDRWMRRFRRWATSRLRDRPFLFGGDLNIAHTSQDIYYAKSNENTSGYLPHERAWFSRLLKSGWHDTTREHFGDVHGPYSWWSNRGRARELDRGWRIDYLLVNSSLKPFVQQAIVHREGGLEVSDHAPVSVDLEWPGQCGSSRQEQT
ncbi:MAG: exodeoxyribonuclease III [Fuerstiella sp.]|nr:exodeoxyribonuclease III [Fuerstiella sp.]